MLKSFEPPSAFDAAAVVAVVDLVVVVVTLWLVDELPAAVVVVAPATVVVVAPATVVEEWCLGLLVALLVGELEPQAAAIRPPATTVVTSIQRRFGRRGAVAGTSGVTRLNTSCSSRTTAEPPGLGARCVSGHS